MRDILFKAKRVDNGEWVEGFYFEFKGRAYITEMQQTFMTMYYTEESVVDFNMRAYEVEVETICQYTGLTDKNGNKIWENDLVGVLTEDGNFKVTWSDTEARYKMESESDCFTVTFDEYWSYEVEVVGNVFDTLWTR